MKANLKMNNSTNISKSACKTKLLNDLNKMNFRTPAKKLIFIP